MDIKNQADEIKDTLVKIRRHIHKHPELGFKEYETTKLIKKELKKFGIKIIDIGTEIGVLAIIEGEKQGHNTVTALRVDIDALPVIESTGLDYASRYEGIMHACGHDGHTTILLGAAKLLNTLKSQFSGTVKFIFQPAEETLEGAKFMVEAGVLKNPSVDNILGFHCWPALEVGKIGIMGGIFMASADKFLITITGYGGHGAYPHKSSDSILAASTAIVQIQNIVSRQIDALDSVVISICTINGGKAFNVIPKEVSFSGTIRCLNNNVRLGIKEKLDTIMQCIAKSFGVKYSLNYEWGVSPVVNDPDIIDCVSKAAEKVLGDCKVEQLEIPSMSSEDFSVYLDKVPKGAYIQIGNSKPDENPSNFHNDHFNFNDDAITVGVSLLTQYIIDQNS